MRFRRAARKHDLIAVRTSDPRGVVVARSGVGAASRCRNRSAGSCGYEQFPRACARSRQLAHSRDEAFAKLARGVPGRFDRSGHRRRPLRRAYLSFFRKRDRRRRHGIAMRKIRNWNFEIRTKAARRLSHCCCCSARFTHRRRTFAPERKPAHRTSRSPTGLRLRSLSKARPRFVWKCQKQLLADEANTAWRIKTDKTTPTVVPLANGREEWKQVYLLNAWPTLGSTAPASPSHRSP